MGIKIGGEKESGFYISFAVAEGSALFLDLPITNIIYTLLPHIDGERGIDCKVVPELPNVT